MLAVCFLVAFSEGIDVQAFGVAAPEIARNFDIAPPLLGVLASAGIVGLIFGSFFGGVLADRIGHRKTLVTMVTAFSLLTFATAASPNYTVMLTVRLLAGIALGGALPVLITYAAEAGGAGNGVGRVTLVMSGMPFGGVLAGAFAATSLGIHWQSVFILGGSISLLAAICLYLLLPVREPAEAKIMPFEDPVKPDAVTALFGGDRRTPTLLLWVAALVTQLVIFLLMNWLPVLLQESGLSRSEASLSIAMFHLSGAVTSIFLGQAMRTTYRRAILLCCYVVVAISLVTIAGIPGNTMVALTSSAIAGGCLVTCQLTIFGIAAEVYPADVRATGVGISTAVGRVGSTLGPLIGGFMAGMGASAVTVLPGLLPLVLIGGISTSLLTRRKPA